MESKIKTRLIFIGTLSVIVTSVIVTLIFQSAFNSQSKRDVKMNADIISESYYYIDNVDELLKFASDDIRITIIAPDGVVLFESDTKEPMYSHIDRPEIKEALNSGIGESLRGSKTLGYEMFYYAVKLKDGNVLRVAKEIEDMAGAYKTVLPLILGMTGAIVILSVIFSVFLTKKIIKSITKMAVNIDEIDEEDVYEELRPFIINMKEQQKKKNDIEKMKQDFTANVSHELKTPLTSISGYAEMIETGMVAEKDIKDFAGKIHHESGRLITLIGDIIKLSEINELGALGTKDFKHVNLYEVVLSTVEALKFNASKMDIDFNIDGDDCYVTGNKGMLEELVYNLCDNAIRYNRQGGKISVSLFREEGKVALRVKDTGIGIPEKYYDRIFERFYRVDKSRSKETGGTGLGLAIVKHIAIQHNAVIAVSSKEGEGTEIAAVFN